MRMFASVMRRNRKEENPALESTMCSFLYYLPSFPRCLINEKGNQWNILKCHLKHKLLIFTISPVSSPFNLLSISFKAQMLRPLQSHVLFCVSHNSITHMHFKITNLTRQSNSFTAVFLVRKLKFNEALMDAHNHIALRPGCGRAQVLWFLPQNSLASPLIFLSTVLTFIDCGFLKKCSASIYSKVLAEYRDCTYREFYLKDLFMQYRNLFFSVDKIQCSLTYNFHNL